MEDKVKAILFEIISNKMDSAPKIEITGSSRLREDLGLDSFNLAELTVYIEDEFDVDIFEDGIVNTVEEIYLKLRYCE
jgi:acyl carrier protein